MSETPSKIATRTAGSLSEWAEASAIEGAKRKAIKVILRIIDDSITKE